MVQKKRVNGLITGTGGTKLAEDVPGFLVLDQQNYDTPYGGQVTVSLCEYDGVRFYHVARHTTLGGEYWCADDLFIERGHRMYCYALFRKLGVTDSILGTAVGSTDGDWMPLGSLVVPKDCSELLRLPITFKDRDLGFTHPTTFHRAPRQPFCPDLRRLLLQANQGAIDGGVLTLALPGPGFEFDPDIVEYHRRGCDLLGMTAVCEARLAREASAHLGCIACITDTPLGGTEANGEEVGRIMRAAQTPIVQMAMATFKAIAEQPHTCVHCTKDPSVFEVIGKEGW